MVHTVNASIFLCHNDPHGDNMMVGLNADGSPNSDEFQLIDFDNAEYGYRAWDFEYYFSYFKEAPSDELIDDMILAYVTEFNSRSEIKYTVDDIRFELDHHRPYVLMEQMLLRRYFQTLSYYCYVSLVTFSPWVMSLPVDTMQ